MGWPNIPKFVWWILWILIILILMVILKINISLGSGGFSFTQGLIN